MDHNKLHNYIKFFLKGKLSQQNEKKLLLWIKQSDDNRKLFIQEQRRLSKEIVSDSDKTINMRWHMLKKKIEHQEGTKKQLFFHITSVAAAFIVGIILSILYLGLNQSGTNQSAQIQTITVPFGARTSTTLPDGSKVWLNAGTTLSYPVVFEESRNVLLNGEAFFEVVKSNNPFVVQTVYGDVKVKGTSFNVKSYENENLQTTVVEGSVSVHNVFSNKEITLLPGQQAEVNNQSFIIKNVATELYTSWTEGKIIFSQAYMPEVAQRLERWYNVKITLDNDPRLNKIWYSGTIEMESFSEVLELLRVTALIDYSYNEKERIITIKYRKN